MKKNYLFVLYTVLILTFVSCGNMQVSDKAGNNTKETSVKFSIRQVGRTIKPIIEKTDFVKFELYSDVATSSGVGSDAPSKIGDTFTSEADLLAATFTDIQVGYYIFTLKAYTSNDAIVFEGSQFKEVKQNQTTEVSFILSPKYTNKSIGYGHFNLRFNIPEQVGSVKAKILNWNKNGKGSENPDFTSDNLTILDDNGTKYVVYSDADLMPGVGINGGQYKVIVSMYLNPNGSESSWAGSHEEIMWIAENKTSEAVRDCQIQYDGYLADVEITGAKGGYTIPTGYINGTTVDELLPPEVRQGTGYKFSGFKDGDGNTVTVLDQTTNGKTLYASWYIEMSIDKFKGQDGASDISVKDWNNIPKTAGKYTANVYGKIESVNGIKIFQKLTLDEQTVSTDKLSAHFTPNANSERGLSPNSIKTTDKEASDTYRFMDEYWVDSDDVYFYCNDNYEYERQTVNNSTAHLVKYDLLISDCENGEQTDYVLKHMNSLVNFKLTGLDNSKKYEKFVLYVPATYFNDWYLVDFQQNFTNNNLPYVYESEETYNHFFLNLGEIDDGLSPENGELSLYAIIPPFDYTGKTVIASLVDEDGNFQIAYLDGKNFEAGNYYEYNSAAEYVPLKKRVSIYDEVYTVNKGAYSPEDVGDYYTFDNKPSMLMGYSDARLMFDENDDRFSAEWTVSHGVTGMKIFYPLEPDNYVFIPANGYKESQGGNEIKDYGNSINLWIGASYDSQYGYSIFADKEAQINGIVSYWDKSYKYGVRDVDVGGN